MIQEVVGCNMKRIRTAVVGTGRIVQDGYLPALKILENKFDTIAVCNKNNRQKGIALSKEYNINYYNDYLEMLKKEELDFIIIATHAITHFEIAKHCIDYGVQLLIEKPVSVKSYDINVLRNISENNRIRVFSSFQRRFNPHINHLLDILDENRIGEIQYICCDNIHYRTQEYFDNKKQGDLDGGGVLLNQALHSIDLLLYLFGELELVSSEISTIQHHITYEDYAVIDFKTKLGVPIRFFATTCAYKEKGYRLYIIGNKGEVVLYPNELHITTQNCATSFVRSYNNSELFVFQLSSIYNCLVNCNIKDMDSRLCSLDDCFNSIRLVERIYEDK